MEVSATDASSTDATTTTTTTTIDEQPKPETPPASSSSSSKLVTLVSNDQVRFEVEKKVARMSKTINTMLQDLDLPDDDEPIPTPEVDARLLRLIVEWATQHVDDDPKGEEGEETSQIVTGGRPSLAEWDQAFFDRLDDGTLFGLIAAANYLNIERLLIMSSKAAANRMLGLKAAEIRARFGIVDDISPEEKERVAKENAYFQNPDEVNQM